MRIYYNKKQRRYFKDKTKPISMEELLLYIKRDIRFTVHGENNLPITNMVLKKLLYYQAKKLKYTERRLRTILREGMIR